MDNTKDREKVDLFFKELDILCRKHQFYLGISKPQFIVQPYHKKEEDSKVDLEKIEVDKLKEMLKNYSSVAEKSSLNASLIKDELFKRNVRDI